MKLANLKLLPSLPAFFSILLLLILCMSCISHAQKVVAQYRPLPSNMMALPRNVSLTYEAKYIPPESRPPAQKTLTHAITAKVAAVPETLASILKVVYLPQPPDAFSNENFTADNAIDNFAASWVVWGGFDLLAKVYFKDGQVIDLPLKHISLTTQGDTLQMYRLHSGTS